MSTSHILLITVDEFRRDSLSCYGNTIIQTPNLDRLAAESIRFDQAYTVSPWCLPARCAILTGLYPHHSGAYSNFRPCYLPSEMPNLFSVFKQSGYQTAMIGKCHFAPVNYKATRPDRTLPFEERDYYRSLGIDHLQVQDGNQVSVWYADDFSLELQDAGYLEAYREAVWNKAYQKVFPFPGPAEWHPDSWVGRKSVKYLKQCDASQPQCLWFSFSGPHYPFDPPEEYLAAVDLEALQHEKRFVQEEEFADPSRIHHHSYYGQGGIDGAGAAPGKACRNYSEEYWFALKHHYYANIVQIDQQIGQILETAYRKLGENILVIFTADHGEMLGNHGLWGKNNCAYEEVWRIPLFVRYPYQQDGQTSSAKVSNLDIFQTFLETTNINGITTDGIPLQQHLTQGGYPYIIAEGEGFLAITDGMNKYVKIDKALEKQVYQEFYNLDDDPHEFMNLIHEPKYQETISLLREKLISFLMESLVP